MACYAQQERQAGGVDTSQVAFFSSPGNCSVRSGSPQLSYAIEQSHSGECVRLAGKGVVPRLQALWGAAALEQLDMTAAREPLVMPSAASRSWKVCLSRSGELAGLRGG